MDDNLSLDLTENINNEIKSNEVVLFMKGTPVFPMCGFSAAVVEILTNIGIKFKSINVLDSEEMREGIKKFSNWPTIPQLYIKGTALSYCQAAINLLVTSPSDVPYPLQMPPTGYPTLNSRWRLPFSNM